MKQIFPLNRKQFFRTFGLAAGAFFAFRWIPGRRQGYSIKRKMTVKPNPHAVQRKSTGAIYDR